MCHESLFFWGKDISQGTPIAGEPCLLYLKSEIAFKLVYMGIVALVVAAIMLFLWIFQYCLWKKYY